MLVISGGSDNITRRWDAVTGDLLVKFKVQNKIVPQPELPSSEVRRMYDHLSTRGFPLPPPDALELPEGSSDGRELPNGTPVDTPVSPKQDDGLDIDELEFDFLNDLHIAPKNGAPSTEEESLQHATNGNAAQQEAEKRIDEEMKEFEVLGAGNEPRRPLPLAGNDGNNAKNEKLKMSELDKKDCYNIAYAVAVGTIDESP